MKTAVDETHEYFEERVQELYHLLASAVLGSKQLADIGKSMASRQGRVDISDLEFARNTVLFFDILIVYGVVVLEEMVKEYIRLHFERCPRGLLGAGDRADQIDAKTVTYREILDADTSGYPGVLSLIIEKELDKLGRVDIDQLAKRVQRILGCSLEDIDGWDNVRRAYYVRNSLVHNRGIISPEFVKKLNYGKAGERISNPKRLWDNLVSSLYRINDTLRDGYMQKWQERSEPDLHHDES